jgi:F-type H+-transporting ATPase subunit b
MNAVVLQTVAEGGGQVAEVARTFGVDWPHLLAQVVSFGIVCLILYAFAYKPILRMLETRREQIGAGLAHAEEIRTRLAQIEIERDAMITAAAVDARQLIEDARGAAARVAARELTKANLAAEHIIVRAREAAARERASIRAELTREVGRLVVAATATVTGKVLTAEDHRRLAEETARQLAA